MLIAIFWGSIGNTQRISSAGCRPPVGWIIRGNRHMSIRIGALAACLAIAAPLVASDARAQTYYIGGQAGWTSLEDQSARATGLPVADARYDSGYAIGARGGIEWGPWRIEEEYTYRSNDLNHL